MVFSAAQIAKAAKGLERSRLMMGKLGICMVKASRSASKTGWTLHVIVTGILNQGPLLSAEMIAFWTRVILADQFPHFENFEVTVGQYAATDP